MKKMNHTKLQRVLRQRRVRSVVKGTAKRPRLSVVISLNNVSAQIVNDEKSVTLASATTVGKNVKGTLTDKAAYVGKEIAVAAKKAKLKMVVFDRRHRLYHGRIKALAEAARAGGLEF